MDNVVVCTNQCIIVICGAIQTQNWPLNQNGCIAAYENNRNRFDSLFNSNETKNEIRSKSLPSSSTCNRPLWTRFISTSCGKLTNDDGYNRLFKLLVLPKALPKSSRTWIGWGGGCGSCFLLAGMDACCCDCGCLWRRTICSWIWWLGPATSTLDDSSLDSPDDKGERSSCK